MAWRWAKVAAAATIMGTLWRYGALDLASISALWHSPGLGLTSAILLFAPLFLLSLRWQLLMRAQSFHLTYRSALRITAIGQFFNTFMPGGIRGDAMRFYYIFGRVTGRRTAAVMSLIVDRLLGLGALLMLASAAILANRNLFQGSGALRSFAEIVIAATTIGILGGLVIVLLPDALLGNLKRPLKRLGRVGSTVVDCVDAVSVYRKQLPMLAVGLVVSLLIQIWSIAGCIAVAQMFDFFGLNWLEFSVAMLLAQFANQVPITPGGFGVGESAFYMIARLMTGVDAPYGTIFLTVRLLSMAGALYGAVVWIGFRPEVALDSMNSRIEPKGP